MKAPGDKAGEEGLAAEFLDNTATADVPSASRALWITAIYAIFATLWIYFSDQALIVMFPDLELLVQASIYKGLAFVGLTSLLLLLMMHWAFGTIGKSYDRLKEQEFELKRLGRLYAALSQINQAIVWSKNQEEMLGKVCGILVDYGRFPVAWIARPEPGGTSLSVVAAYGRNSSEIAEKISRGGVSTPLARALQSGEHCICNTLEEDPESGACPPDLLQYGVQACGSFPIRTGQQI